MKFEGSIFKSQFSWSFYLIIGFLKPYSWTQVIVAAEGQILFPQKASALSQFIMSWASMGANKCSSLEYDFVVWQGIWNLYKTLNIIEDLSLSSIISLLNIESKGLYINEAVNPFSTVQVLLRKGG